MKSFFTIFVACFLFFSCSEAGGVGKTAEEDLPYVPKRTPRYGIVDSFVRLHTDVPMVPTEANSKARFDELKAKEYFDLRDIDTPVKVQPSKFARVVIGDLNMDEALDVLYPYEILGGSKEDSCFFYYLVLLNNGENLVPVEHFYAGCREAELFTSFESISDSGVVKGHQIPGIINKYPDKFPIKYYFDGKELMAK